MINKYKVYSLNLAAYLSMCGFSGKIEQDIEGKNYYIFPQDAYVAQAVEEYRRNTTMVNLSAFLSAFREIRQQLSNWRNG